MQWEKRKHTVLLISFSDNYECSLILHQNLTSRGVVCGLAVIWNWVSHKLSVFCYILFIRVFYHNFGILITLKILFHWVIAVQSPSHVQFFVSPWTTAHQASLSLTFSWILPKFMSIELYKHWRSWHNTTAKMHIHNITTHPTGKLFKYWEADKNTAADIRFPKFYFSPES